MAFDLSGLGVPELERLIQDARARIDVVKRQNLAELRRTLESQAKTAGFDIYELFGGRKSTADASSEKKPVAPKYRNPKNAAQTWTGRGKQPLWVRDALAEGATIGSLAI